MLRQKSRRTHASTLDVLGDGAIRHDEYSYFVSLAKCELQELREGLLKRMGHYFEQLFGDKLSVAAGAIVAFACSVYAMAFSEGGEVIALVIAAVIALFVSDLILGMLNAIRKGTFSSRGFSRSLEKIVVYTLAVAGMSAFGVIVPAIPIAAGFEVTMEIVVASARGFFLWTLFLIGLTEFISIVENLKCLGFRLPKQIYHLIDTVQKRLNDAVPSAGESEEDEEDGEGDGERGT